MKFLATIIIFIQKAIQKINMYMKLSLFKKCGKNVTFGVNCNFSYSNIILGNDVYIGPGATFNSAISTIKIGNKIMFGPNVTIMGGDHRFNVVGKYMFDVHEKLPSNDKDVIIEDDVWVGSNVIILKGVTIGEGSIIGAGSIVVKDIPPYSVYVGSPPLKLMSRWDEKNVNLHRQNLKK